MIYLQDLKIGDIVSFCDTFIFHYKVLKPYNGTYCLLYDFSTKRKVRRYCNVPVFKVFQPNLFY